MPRKIKICIEEVCNNVQTTKEYCRLHYLKNWKTIKTEEKRKATKRLNRYVEGIIQRNYDSSEKSDGDTRSSNYKPSATEEVESLIEDLGYSDPDSLDEIISNLKSEK